MSKLILHYPDQSFNKLEEVSYLLRNEDTLNIEDFLRVSDFRNYKQVCTEMDAYIKELKYQFGAKQPRAEDDEEDDGGDDEPEEIPQIECQVQNLLQDSQMWQWAGIGFG